MNHNANGPGPSPTPLTLNDIVREMTADGINSQPYTVLKYSNRTGREARTWKTPHAGLLRQLDHAITQRAVIGVHKPTPPGMADTKTMPHFDADSFDRRRQIGREVANYLAYLHIPSASHKIAGTITGNLVSLEHAIKSAHPITNTTAAAIDTLREVAAAIRRSTEPDLRLLLTAEMDDDTASVLLRDAGHWRTWCRIFAGWDGHPPAEPRIDSPCCGAPQGPGTGLRVRFEDSGTGLGTPTGHTSVQAAVCLSCNATWDERTIGLLTRHIGEEIDPDAPQRDELPVAIADAAEIVHDGGRGHGPTPAPRKDPS